MRRPTDPLDLPLEVVGSTLALGNQYGGADENHVGAGLQEQGRRSLERLLADWQEEQRA